jgi:hypothetical protein
MKFSLILNSRKRPQFLFNFIKSIFEKTKSKEDVEILIRIDNDDPESLKLAEYKFNLNVKFFCGNRPTNLHKSINELVFLSRGDNIFVCNDDIQIITQDWDLIAEENINKYKQENNITDNIYYCKTSCNSADRDHSKGYCSFPIISREAVNTIGFFMYDSFVGLGGDSSIYRVYDSIDRVIDLSNLQIDHILHRTVEAVINPDITAAEMRMNSARNSVDPYSLDISKEVQKLKSKINETRKS